MKPRMGEAPLILLETEGWGCHFKARLLRTLKTRGEEGPAGRWEGDTYERRDDAAPLPGEIQEDFVQEKRTNKSVKEL